MVVPPSLARGLADLDRRVRQWLPLDAQPPAQDPRSQTRPGRRRFRDPRRQNRPAPSPLSNIEAGLSPSSSRAQAARSATSTCRDCPTLLEFLKMRDVDFLAINSNASDSIEDVAEHARRLRLTFPVLKDPENRVADQLLAERTCEALVIDGRGRLRYRGAIDDQYGLGTRRDSPERNYLVDAIESVLAGREVSPDNDPGRRLPDRAQHARQRHVAPGPPAARLPEQTPSKQEQASSAGTRLDPGPVTYATDVATILHRRCLPCHRRGQVAPFSLLTYDHARRWAASIAEVIADGRMPPWHADPRYGQFANDRSLSAHERSVLNDWIDQGTPPGELSKAPDPPKFSHGWSIGTPDIIFEMPESVPGPGGRNAAHPTLPPGDPSRPRISGSRLRKLAPAIGPLFIIFVFISTSTARVQARVRGTRTCSSLTPPATCPRSFLPESPRRSRPAPN